MDNDHITLDELIQIVNNPNPSYNTQPHPSKEKLPPVQQPLITKPMPNTLSFKPWSGKANLNYGISIFEGEENRVEVIKEQIENQEQSYYPEKEDYVEEANNPLNKVSQGDIGYFYKFHAGKVRLIKYLLDQNGFKDAQNNKNWTLYWSSSAIKAEVYHALLPYQKVNHFPNSFHITRKDLMNKAISKMQAKYGITNFNFLPKSYILPQQLQIFTNEAQKSGNTYIVKPHNRSQGKGIIVTSSIQTVLGKLQKYSSLIVSHYIENPLLINRLKFDLRIYVAITGVNPLRIYVYDEGLARFATEQYEINGYQCENKFQHLTNYSVNKKNIDFIQSNTDDYFGSKWSLTSMKDFLSFNIGKNQTNQLFEKINDLIVKTLLSVQNTLFTSFTSNVPYINSCFEVFGFDVLVDSNLKPWLVEVNLSPSMNTDSALDLKIKGNMIADLFTMIGVTPLSERYLDGGHSRYQTRHYVRSEELKRQDSAIDRFIIRELEAQNQRSGGWKRVFPTRTGRYKNYFEVDRYFNRIVRESFTEGQKYFMTNGYKSTGERKQVKKGTQKVSIRINRSKKMKKSFHDNSLY